MMRAGLCQLSVGDLPDANVPMVRDAVRAAVRGGSIATGRLPTTWSRSDPTMRSWEKIPLFT